MGEDTGRRPPREKRHGITMRELAAGYAPRKLRDHLFLHGLAVIAARRALREGDRLYVPREWERAHPADDREDWTPKP